jgi:hypothetical protein
MESYRRTIAAAIATILTSVALYPVFSGGVWFWAGAGATVIIAIAGTLTRLRRLPLVVCVAGGLAGLLLYLNLAFAAGSSLLWLIPTPASLSHLWDLAAAGISDSAKYAPPVPELSGMVLLAAAGIGLTALLTDLIAVRLGSAALAGLPLLLLFTEPFTLSVSRGWAGTTAVFCLAAAGYLVLLGVEGKERIKQWEQPRPGPAAVPDTRALTAAGRRVGVASVLVALFIPMLVPGLHVTRLFGGGSAGIGGNGAGGVGFPSPQTQLSKELREARATPVLQYTSTDPAPGYLQVYVLDDLTASGWQLGPHESVVPMGPGLPTAPGLSAAAPKQYETTHVTIATGVAQDDLLALPAPYPAVLVRSQQGTLQADPGTLMILDSGARLAGLRYTVTSWDVNPPQSALADAPGPAADVKDHDLEVPSSYDGLRGLAQSVTAAAATPYDKAVALQNWLAGGNFIYTLNAPTVTNASQLASFLNSTHSGYCQQFSFAMAVLARLLGIPARVAYGFTQGTEKDGTWHVTSHDAHAWPELYFQGFGWLRFEPTPAGLNGQGTATSPGYAHQPAGSTGPVSSAPTSSVPTTSPSGGAGNSKPPTGRGRQYLAENGYGTTSPAAGAAQGLGPWALAGLSLLALLAVLAVSPAAARAVIRRRRWRAGARAGDAGLARAAWLELRDELTDYGAGYFPSESPRALAARVTRELALTGPEESAALGRVALAAERASYSARPASGVTLEADSAIIRRAVAAATPRRRRWRARLFPASVVSPAVLMVSQATDVFARLTRREQASAS